MAATRPSDWLRSRCFDGRSPRCCRRPPRYPCRPREHEKPAGQTRQMMGVKVCPENGPAIGFSASEGRSDNLVAVIASRPPNFVAICPNVTENRPKRPGNLADVG